MVGSRIMKCLREKVKLVNGNNIIPSLAHTSLKLEAAAGINFILVEEENEFSEQKNNKNLIIQKKISKSNSTNLIMIIISVIFFNLIIYQNYQINI